MKKIKVSEASGPALDYMVAKCEGIDCSRLDGSGWTTDCFNPSTDWAQGGPIIERERITIRYWDNDERVTAYMQLSGGEITPWHHGPTPLITAMRCYVASKLGDYVEIPKELE